MKFLSKTPDSIILIERMVYSHQSKENQRLRAHLVDEQFRFCAYTERFFALTDSIEIEHFDPEMKFIDDYYNYYAVLSWANKAKLKKKYLGSRFFQNEKELRARVQYSDGKYRTIIAEDREAESFIEFLSFNDEALMEDRNSHIHRLHELFDRVFATNMIEFLDYLKRNRHELSFPTAIEAEFGIDLADIIAQK